MNLKDFLKQLLTSFFIVVTLVNVAMAVLGMTFDSGHTFSYEAYFSPLIYGFLSLLPSAVMYSKKELSIPQMLLRKLLQLFMMEGLLIGFVILNGIVEPQILLPLAAAILLVFLAVTGILWLLDLRSAKELNQELAEYQRARER